MTMLKKTALAALAAAGLAQPAAAEVTLINVFEVPEGRIAATIDAWEAARAFLSQEPGYIDTALHRSVTPTARFQLINVATWESAEAFAAATQKMRAAGVFPPIPGLAIHPALYTVVRTDAPDEVER